jgi:AcrR family transcriptional regulator
VTDVTDRHQRMRDELLDAARRVVARKGLLAMTTADIAAEAGCAPATLYRYYPSKLDLAYALARGFDSAATQPSPGRGDDAEIRDQIRHAVTQFWSTFREQLAVAVGAFQLAMIEREFNDEWAEIRHGVTERFARSIGRLQERGAIPRFDPRPVASALGVTMFHMAIVAHYFGEGPSGGEGTEESLIEAMTDLWYRAITRPP